MTPTTLLKNINTINHENIIFDLTGVLFHLGKNAISKEIGLPTVLWYSLTHWHNPLKFGEVLIDFLNHISPATNGMHYRNSPLPDLVCQWLRGEKESIQIRKEIAVKIEILDKENYFKSSLEKEIFSKALDTIFTPKKMLAIGVKPIKPGIELLKAFHAQRITNGKKKHKIYLLSNFDKESLTILRAKHPEIFGLLDGIVISAIVGVMKPDRGIYDSLLSQYNLDPKTCFFIDDQADNIIAAQKLDISGVQFIH